MNRQIEIVLNIQPLNVYKAKLTEEQKTAIEQVYNHYGRNFTKRNCNGCYENAYLYIKSKLTKSTIMEETRLFTLAGRRLAMHGVADVLTSANCTNERCLTILKKTPAAIKFFETYPDNWKELSERFEPLAVAKRQAKKSSTQTVESIAVDNAKEKAAEAEAIAAEELRKDKIASMNENTVKELKAFAEESGYDVEEYKKLNKVKLIDYLIAKVD